MGSSDIEITKEIMEAVALACLYREDESLAIRKVIGGKKLGSQELDDMIRKIKASAEFKEIKDEVVKMEEATLIDDNLNTILLQYNKMIREAQYEKKYEVAARLLKEVREIKSINSNENDFRVIFTVRPPDKENEK